MYRNILLMLSIVVSVAFVSVFVAPVFAEEQVEPVRAKLDLSQNMSLKFSDIWARESMSSNSNSAIYMKISNPTDRQIAIIGASAPMVAAIAELHESFVDERGVSRMMSVDKILVPANSVIELKPGAIHVMLFDLKRQLSPGDKFIIDMELEDKEKVAVEATVR